jgi:hypothetical protein
VPSKQGIGLDDEQGTLPSSEPASQQHQQGPVSICELRSADLSVYNDELLTQQGVVDYQFLLTATGVQHCTYQKRITSWPFPNLANNTAQQHREGKHDEEPEKLNQSGMRLLAQVG